MIAVIATEKNGYVPWEHRDYIEGIIKQEGIQVIRYDGGSQSNTIKRHLERSFGHIIFEKYIARNKTLGASAGAIRNREMLLGSRTSNKKADVVISLKGRTNTANCKAIARDLGIKVVEIINK